MGRESARRAGRIGPRLGALGLAALMLAGCQSDTDPNGSFGRRTPRSSPTGSDNDVIVLIGTSSGDGAWRGDGAFRGADLGVSHLNRTRSEDDPIVELVTLDDGGDAEEAVRLLDQVAAEDRTIGVVFAGPPIALTRAEPALAAGQVPALLSFGDLHAAGLLSDHVFQLSPSYRWQSDRLARYIARDRRYRKVGGLVRDSLSGRVARRSLREAFRRLGGRPPRFESFSEPEEIPDALRRLRRRRVEALVLEGSPTDGMSVLQEMDRMNALYSTTSSARIASAPTRARARVNARRLRPQLLGFDGLIAQVPDGVDIPEGTVAADSYSRGAHYLPIPSLRRFRDSYVDWWGEQPLNWERRSYEAVRLIGWAARNTPEGGDPADTLETVRGERFGGLEVSFGPRDHVADDPSSVGLWVVPRRGVAPESGRLPRDLPWVPLWRGFPNDGGLVTISAADRRFLFRGPPVGPPPVRKARFGVSTGRGDPFH